MCENNNSKNNNNNNWKSPNKKGILGVLDETKKMLYYSINLMLIDSLIKLSVFYLKIFYKDLNGEKRNQENKFSVIFSSKRNTQLHVQPNSIFEAFPM